MNNDKPKRAYCTEGRHFPDKVVALAANAELAVFVNADDTVTHWADGTSGVPDEVAELAREDESPVCADHLNCEVEWREDCRCKECDGTGIAVSTDWVPYGYGNIPMESEDYCNACLMSNENGDGVTGKCPCCGNPVKWNEKGEYFEVCPVCGATDPFKKEASK